MKLTKSPIRRHAPYAFLIVAVVWAVAVLIILTKYHLAEPLGVKSITVNGHTYVGNPPALTLPQRDVVSFAVMVIAMGVGLLLGIVDLIFRTLNNLNRWGFAAVVSGLLLILLSLFGLLIGFATVGIEGIFLTLVGLPLNSRD